MATSFDLNEALNRRYGAPGTSKVDALLEASDRKIKDLSALHEETVAARIAAQPQQEALNRANAQSWVGQAGLGPDSVGGTLLNAFASYTAGAGRFAGQVASFPASVASEMKLSGLTQEDFDAFGAYQAGKATPEQMARLTTKRSMLGDPNQQAIALPEDPHAREAQLAREAMQNRLAIRNAGRGAQAAPLDKINEADNLRQLARDVNTGFDFTSTVNQSARAQLSKDLKEGFDTEWTKVKDGTATEKLSGIANLIAKVGSAAADNPKASMEYLIENIPQLVAGMGGGAGMTVLTASNFGYAMDNYQKGIEKFQKENQGAYPDEGTRREMAMWAMSTAAAEQAGDVVSLGGAKALKGALNAAKNVAEDLTSKSVRTAFKEALRVPGAIAAGAGTEGITEGFQTYAEAKAGLTEAKPEDIYESAAIGGIVGGAMRGAPTAAVQVVEGTTSFGNAVKAEVNKRTADDEVKSAALKKAVESGDVADLVDPTKNTYAPDVAINALNNLSKDEATKKENLSKATDVLAGLDAQIAEAETMVNVYSPEQADAQRARLQDPALDQATRTDIEEYLKTVASDHKAATRDLSKLQALREKAAIALDQFTTGSVDGSVDVDTEVNNIRTGTPEVAQESAKKIVSLAMMSPDSLDENLAQELANDTNLNIGEEERAYLRMFSEARAAENLLKNKEKVNNDILNGGKGYIGLNQYRKQMAAALGSGNQKEAQRLLGLLENFAADHSAKFEVAQEIVQSGESAQLVRTDDGAWAINSGPRLNDKDLRTNGGLNINPLSAGSLNLVQSIGEEADAISKMAAELTQAIKLQPSIKSSNVKDVPQPTKEPEGSTVQGASQQEAQVAAGSTQGAESNGAGRVAPAGQPQASNEALSSTQKTEKTGTTQEAPASTEQAQSQSESQTKKVETSQAPEQQEADERSETVAEQPTEKALTVFSLDRDAERTKPFQQRNLVAAYVRQAGNQALGRTREFLSKAGSLAEVLKKEVSEQQEAAFTFLKEKVQEWAPVINGNIVKTNPDYNYRNMVQFLVNEDGTFDENVITGMATAAMDYVSQYGFRTVFNNWEDINTILHRDLDTQVSPSEQALLATAGTQETVVVGQLGQAALRILGFKEDGDTPKNILANLQTGLGGHILDLMVNQGILVENKIDGAEFLEALDTEPGPGVFYKPGIPLTFYRLNVDEDGNPVPHVREIMDKVKESKGAFSEVFGSEVGVIAPKLAPSKYNQKSIKGTDRTVPKGIAAANDKLQNTPFLVKQDHWKVLNALPEQSVLALAGFIKLDTSVQASLHESIKATNDGIKKGWESIKEFVGSYLEGDLVREFFIEPLTWVNQRVGVKTQLVDPQANKLHRYVTKMGTWNTKVFMDNLDNFRLRVMEGLGDKTDETPDAVTLQRYEALVGQEAIKKGVEAIRKALQGQPLTEQDGAVVEAAVAKGGEKMHSFDALMALAKYEEAVAAGQDSFDVEMSVEDDGKTNGPMLSFLLFGAAYNQQELADTMAKGGFYPQGSGLEQYSQWRSQAGNEDLYQSTMRVFNTALSQMANMHANDPGYGEMVNAIYSFTGTLVNGVTNKVEKGGRDIVKTPLQAIFFGSSPRRAAESMSEKLVEGVLKRVQKLTTNPGDLPALIKDLQTLGLQVSNDTTVNQFMNEFFLSKQEIKHLESVFYDLIGQHVEASVESHFAPFLEAKKAMNKAANLTFHLYNAAFEAVKAKKIQALIDSGEMPLTLNKKGPKKAVFDLSKNQEKEIHAELKGMFPVMHSWMSQIDGDLGAGLSMMNTDIVLTKNSAYVSEVKTKAGTRTLSAPETQASEPGVKMLSASVHSFDSGISHLTGLEVDSINNHDARTTGLNELQSLAQMLNKSTWDGLLNYSPLASTKEALDRAITGFANLVESGVLDQNDLKAAAEYLSTALKTKDLNKALGDVVGELSYISKNADSLKLEFLSQLGSVDQYPLQGGNYKVSDTDRAAAQTKLAEVQAQQLNANADAVAKVMTALSGTSSAVSQPAPKAAPVTTPFGTLGHPKNAQNDVLVRFFEENPSTTVGALLPVLKEQIKAEGNSFAWKLVGLMEKSLNKNLPVIYATKNTPVTSVTDNIPGVAWYTSAGDQSQLVVVGTDFTKARVVPSVMVHELVHATVYDVMQAEREKKKANPKYDSEILQLEGDLEKLLARARETIKSQALTGFDSKVKNVDELIAYGMMDPTFQRFLSGITLPVKDLNTGKSKMVNLMKQFIENITKIFFASANRIAQQGDIDGMSLLIANTSALMATASMAATPATAPSVQPSSLAMSPETDPMSQVENLDTVGMYEALSSGVSQHSPSFNARAVEMLRGIVNKLHGPFGAYYDKVARAQASDALDVMVKAIQTGKMPFVSEIFGSPFRASQQEMFVMDQIEATVRAAIEGGGTASTTLAYTQLSKLYREAREKVKAEDFLKEGATWATATADEKNEAQAQYNFVFKIEGGADNRSVYLSRFAALGLGHEKFSSLLQFDTDAAPSLKEQGGLVDRLMRVWENILDFFGSKIMGVYAGQPADDKLNALVDHLVDIEAKRRLAEAHKKALWLGSLKGAVRDMTAAARKKIGAIASSPKVRQSTSKYVRGAGAIARVLVDDKLEAFMDSMGKFRDLHIKDRQSFGRDMMTEIKGLPDRVMKLLLEAKRNNEQKRQDVIASTEKTLLKEFKDGGKNLTTRQKEAVTQVLIRTGAHVLLKDGRFSLDDLTKLVSDRNVVKKAINDLKAELGALAGTQGTATFLDFWIEQANVLGKYTATNRAVGEHMLMNAHNIARLAGTPYMDRVTEGQAEQIEPLVEALVALFGLNYTATSDLIQAKNVMLQEGARTDGNGIKLLLGAHASMDQQSLENLFGGQKALMVHGYTPELYNTMTEIKVASEVDGRNLELQGWKKIGTVTNDPADPNGKVGDQYMYALKGAGLQPYLSGIMSLTDTAAKGHPIHNGFMNTKTTNGLMNAQALSSVMHAHAPAVKAMMGSTGKHRDLSTAKDNFLVPVFNEQGQIVNYRYLMNKNTKDTVLERDSRFEKVMGAFAGSVYDKTNSREQNKKAVVALKEEYLEGRKTQPQSFVFVGKGSNDPQMKEIWDMLPKGTQDDIRAEWGQPGMWVRLDSLNTVFGYRKFSLSEMFRKNPDARGHLERITVDYLENFVRLYGKSFKHLSDADADQYAKRAMILMARTERGWQEVVKELKDIIVVKSMVVLAGNIWSNFSFLMLQGVPLKNMVRDHKVALQGATEYMRDSNELARLETLKSAGYLDTAPKDIDSEIARLKDAIARNPVTELIDAGLMPTIVDDVSLQDDPYAYKTVVTKWAEDHSKWMPEGMKTAAKTVYMAKETALYQFLSRTTQLSDFVARYTLYQHLTQRSENPMSKEDAILAASDAFVNYDVPLPKGLQYTDDMGFTMFSKYFLRIQRVLMQMIRENPARVVAMIGIDQLMDLGPVVLESSWIKHIGNNPLNAGAFQYPTTLDELLTVQAGLKLLK